MATQDALVKVEGLRKLYPVASSLFRRSSGFIHAVDEVSFAINPGESLGLVGESGCGKTTTGKLLVKLIEPTAGRILMGVNGERQNVAGLRGRPLKAYRRRVQMVFQDPYESMNPRRTIFDTIAEPLEVQGIGNVVEREERVAHLLDLVGLDPPASFLFRFPHELSGGQRQRVAIARALVIEPIFIVADEPTSMLDVSIRTDIMHLMQDLAQRLHVTYLYITHDLAVARYMCDRIAVMYLGKVVEVGGAEAVLQRPRHPYTQALISAVPVPDPRVQRAEVKIKGGISKPINPPPRCRFFDRCPLADEVCRENDHPPLQDMGGGHQAACYHI